MFCTKCGAVIYENENFCSKCGNPVKGRQPSAEKAVRNDESIDFNAPLVVNITPEKAAEMMKRTADEKDIPSAQRKSGKKGKNQAAFVLVGVLIVLIVLLVGVGVVSNQLNATTPQEIISALNGSASEDETDASLSNAESNTTESYISTTAETTTTSKTTTQTTTTTTTTSTTATTSTAATTAATTTARTSSEQALLAQQAREIAQLLVSKKWKTTVSGYDALITFKKDGTAIIEVDVKVGFFSVTQKVDATYEISSNCFAVIKGEYNGMKMGISGIITKISENELLVDRGGDLGTLTLKAVR